MGQRLAIASICTMILAYADMRTSVLCIVSIIFYSIGRYVDNSYLMFQHLRLICCLASTSVYVDGTENAGDIDERDSTYMVEMAKRGYVAVTVDYGKSFEFSCVIDC